MHASAGCKLCLQILFCKCACENWHYTVTWCMQHESSCTEIHSARAILRYRDQLRHQHMSGPWLSSISSGRSSSHISSAAAAANIVCIYTSGWPQWVLESEALCCTCCCVGSCCSRVGCAVCSW